MTDPAFKLLADNAFSFLLRGGSDVVNRPNLFAVGVHTAVELVLKARLVHEHWSLMVSKTPNRAKFEAGDFVSVTFEEACLRLRDIVQDPLPEATRVAFDELRKIRNRIVHFSPPEGAAMGRLEINKIEATTRAAGLRAWALLIKLLEEDWAGPFAELQGHIEEVARAGARAEASLNALSRDFREPAAPLT